MNYKLTVVPLALSAALYLTGCGGQSNYTPQKVIEKPKMKYKLNVSTMEGANIKVGDAQYTPNIELLEGTHTVIVSKDGYENETLSLTLDSDKNITTKLKKAFQFEGNIIWESDNDTIPNYFKLSAENNLLIALPPSGKISYPNIYFAHIHHNESPLNTAKLHLSALPLEQGSFSGKYYPIKSDTVFDANKFRISGMKGWNLPSSNDLYTNKAFKNVYYHYEDFFGFIPAKYIVSGVCSNGNLFCGMWLNGNRNWEQNILSYGIFTVVKPISNTQQTAFQGVNHSLDAKSKIKHYAKIATNAQLRAKLRPVTMYSIIDFPQIPTLLKGEFETTADFEKRQAKSIAEWEQTKKNIEAKNLQAKERYYNEIEKAKIEFEEEEKLFADENYRNKIYKEFINEASGLFLGNPTFQDISYDADRAKMKATIVSSNDTTFKQTVEFDVSLANAKQTKEDILAKKLVPHITLNHNLDIESFKVVTNDTKISMEFEFANSENTINAYESFINKYLNTSFAKKAKDNIAKIKESERITQIANEKKRQKEMEAYTSKKSIGNKICQYMTQKALWLSHTYTITGFVESVSGAKIQIRLSDIAGAIDLNYNGTKLRNGAILWDDANSWKKCD